MTYFESAGLFHSIQTKGCHDVQSQQGQVCQIIIGQPFVFQMGVDTPETTEPGPSTSIAGKIWNQNPPLVSNDYILDVSFSVDKNS